MDMSSAEYTSWIAFDQLSPIGGERWDYLFATLIAHVVGMFATKPPRIVDCLPFWAETPKAKHPGSSKEELLAWAEAVKKRQAIREARHGN